MTSTVLSRDESIESSSNMPGSGWDTHRQTITKLYLDEKRTLDEVIECMRREHHFVASKKMYKARLKKWRVDKNFRRHEVIAMLVLQSHYRVAGSLAKFTIRGRIIDPENLERHVKRARIDVSELHGIRPLDARQMAPDLVCQIQPAPVRMLNSPDNLYRFESLFHATSTYINGTLDSSLCYLNEKGQLVWTSGGPRYEMKEIQSLFRLGTQKFNNKMMHEAGSAWRLAFVKSETLVDIPDPISWLAYVSLQISIMHSLPRNVRNALKSHLLTLIEARHKASSPHRLFAKTICSLDDSDLQAALSLCRKVCLRTWRAYLPGNAMITMQCFLDASIGFRGSVALPIETYDKLETELHLPQRREHVVEHLLGIIIEKMNLFFNTNDWVELKYTAQMMIDVAPLLLNMEEQELVMLFGIWARAHADFELGHYIVAKAGYEASLDRALRCRQLSIDRGLISPRLLHQSYSNMDWISNCSEIADGNQQWNMKMREIEKDWESELVAAVGHLDLDTPIPSESVVSC